MPMLLAAFSARLSRSSLRARRCSACFSSVMSRPTETSRCGWPSGPGSGEITTSHHFGVPLWVSQKA